MQTNLYDFLRRIQEQANEAMPKLANDSKMEYAGPLPVHIWADQLSWLNQYLDAPDVEIHFKARKVGEEAGEPVMAQDYAIKGEPIDLFSLLCEAMLQNPQFADIVVNATGFFINHAQSCESCLEAINMGRAIEDNKIIDYSFKPHK